MWSLNEGEWMSCSWSFEIAAYTVQICWSMKHSGFEWTTMKPIQVRNPSSPVGSFHRWGVPWVLHTDSTWPHLDLYRGQRFAKLPKLPKLGCCIGTAITLTRWTMEQTQVAGGIYSMSNVCRTTSGPLELAMITGPCRKIWKMIARTPLIWFQLKCSTRLLVRRVFVCTPWPYGWQTCWIYGGNLKQLEIAPSVCPVPRFGAAKNLSQSAETCWCMLMHADM